MTKRIAGMLGCILMLTPALARAGLEVGWQHVNTTTDGSVEVRVKAANTDWQGQRTFDKIEVAYTYAAKINHGWGATGTQTWTRLTLTGSPDPSKRESDLLVFTTKGRVPAGGAHVILSVTWWENGQERTQPRTEFDIQ